MYYKITDVIYPLFWNAVRGKKSWRALKFRDNYSSQVLYGSQDGE